MSFGFATEPTQAGTEHLPKTLFIRGGISRVAGRYVSDVRKALCSRDLRQSAEMRSLVWTKILLMYYVLSVSVPLLL
jgi:hypothetical protein